MHDLRMLLFQLWSDGGGKLPALANGPEQALSEVRHIPSILNILPSRAHGKHLGNFLQHPAGLRRIQVRCCSWFRGESESLPPSGNIAPRQIRQEIFLSLVSCYPTPV